jgi:hypothetical protein
MIHPIFYFVVLLLVEGIVVLLISQKKAMKVLPYVVLINLFTWPCANGLFLLGVNFFLIEVGIIIVEALLLKYLIGLSLPRASIAAFLANAITAAIGFLV